MTHSTDNGLVPGRLEAPVYYFGLGALAFIPAVVTQLQDTIRIAGARKVHRLHCHIQHGSQIRSVGACSSVD